ncbi:hypothetical protein VTK73DRAFT_3733 [Phialemonium thermophilum]|uniref:Uncharacterized protein n=1 Tax=Phialemonium thermophilum TaxID=223376 RepID=A0ABR3VFA7_9PEZI
MRNLRDFRVVFQTADNPGEGPGKVSRWIEKLFGHRLESHRKPHTDQIIRVADSMSRRSPTRQDGPARTPKDRADSLLDSPAVLAIDHHSQPPMRQDSLAGSVSPLGMEAIGPLPIRGPRRPRHPGEVGGVRPRREIDCLHRPGYFSRQALRSLAESDRMSRDASVSYEVLAFSGRPRMAAASFAERRDPWRGEVCSEGAGRVTEPLSGVGEYRQGDLVWERKDKSGSGTSRSSRTRYAYNSAAGPNMLAAMRQDRIRLS